MLANIMLYYYVGQFLLANMLIFISQYYNIIILILNMLAKHADTFTHVSQSIWESRL
jgi:hypothetical protein